MVKKARKHLDILYFAYGSNLHLDQMKRRCPDSEVVAEGILHDYELTFRGNWKGNGVADVIPSEGEQVVGGLFRVSRDDLAALDRYEGYPFLYERHFIEIETAQGVAEAFVYRMRDQFKLVAPGGEYYGVIRDGYQMWGFDRRLLAEARKNVIETIKESAN